VLIVIVFGGRSGKLGTGGTLGGEGERMAKRERKQHDPGDKK